MQRATSLKHISRLHLKNWAVDLFDFQDFDQRVKLSRSLFELLAQSFRSSAPPTLSLGKAFKTTKGKLNLSARCEDDTRQIFDSFPFFSPAGYLTIYIVQRTRNEHHDLSVIAIFVLQMTKVLSLIHI